MRYLTNLFTPETYEIWSDQRPGISGFPRSQKRTAERVDAGDIFICYLTKLSRWVGVLRVVEGPFEDHTPVFATEDDRYVIRFKVEPIVWLPKELGVPIRDSILWDHLSFTRDLPTGSTSWTGKLRRSLVDLSPEDGELLRKVLGRQAENGTEYPVDGEWYARLLPRLVQRKNGHVSVVVPDNGGNQGIARDSKQEAVTELRESHRIQGVLAQVGEAMGFKVWLPRGDRSNVMAAWSPRSGTLLEKLPLNYDEVTLKTVEQIDVLWLKGRSIVRAFEVEHTTAVYSGILRMADLLALQPNMDIKLHIVAPVDRKDKVMAEIRRPVFSLLEKGALARYCTFLSYDSLDELAVDPHLSYMSDAVLSEYEEVAG